MPNQNHEFLEGNYPYTINPGGPNHEELVSLIGIYEYFDNLFNHHFKIENITIREKISRINNLISDHEEYLANPLLDFLDKNKNFFLIGKSKIVDKNRAPTISFIHKKRSSKDLSNYLVKNNIATRNDNFYAWRCLKSLNIDPEDGVVRVSLTHYNSKNEVDKLISLLNDFN